MSSGRKNSYILSVYNKNPLFSSVHVTNEYIPRVFIHSTTDSKETVQALAVINGNDFKRIDGLPSEASFQLSPLVAWEVLGIDLTPLLDRLGSLTEQQKNLYKTSKHF